MNALFIGTKQALQAKIDQILWTQQEKALTQLGFFFLNCLLRYHTATMHIDSCLVTPVTHLVIDRLVNF